MKAEYAKLLEEHNRLFAEMEANIAPLMEELVNDLAVCFKAGRKFLIFGNGGSAADAQHFSAELMGRFKKERIALPAWALTTNSSLLTALGNDYDYDQVFARQIIGIAEPGDVVLGISTSGNAKNVVEGFKAAREQGALTYLLGGGNGGRSRDLAEKAILVPSDNTPRIQEAHIFIIHAVCELLEETLFN